jgi:transcriptional regulator with XRE-family HTH domain
MSDFAAELARLMAARGLGVRELARTVPCNPRHISNLRSGKARPSPELAKTLDERLAAGGSLRALAPDRSPGRRQLTPALDDSAIADEIAALDLVRQAKASQVGSGTVERLELAVDDLATAYPGTPAAVLLDRVRGYLGYVTRLLDAKATLAEHRRLLVRVHPGHRAGGPRLGQARRHPPDSRHA